MFEIRAFAAADAAGLRACVVELQEFERALDARLRPGEEMADAYCERIHERCRAAHGQILVAEQAGEVAGFVSVVARQPFTELDDPPGTYALVTDLVVREAYRRRGMARALLARAESFAREAGASELRIGVMSGNTGARRLYEAAAFTPYLEILSKRW